MRASPPTDSPLSTWAFAFELEPALRRSGSSLLANLERLRLALEPKIAAAAPAAFVRFAGAAFDLTISARSEAEALGIAFRVNLAVLGFLFGSDGLRRHEHMRLFRQTRNNDSEKPSTGSPSPVPREPIEMRFVPVHDLRRNCVSTFFCTPAVSIGGTHLLYGYKAFQHQSPREFPIIDEALLRFSMLFSQRLKDEGVVAAVGTSVHFETLAWPKGREAYISALKEAGAARDPYLLLKIEEAPGGVPASRLADLVSAVRPFVRRVFVHVPDMDSGFDGTQVGATGFVASMPSRPTRPIIAAVAKSLMRICEHQMALACIDSIRSEEALSLVRAIGVRFAAGSVFGDVPLKWNDSVDTVRSQLPQIPKAVAGASRPVEANLPSTFRAIA